VTGEAHRPDRPTRELLQALMSLLDVPSPADWNDRERFSNVVRARTATALGAMNAALSEGGATLESAAGVCRKAAAEPLGYEPAPEPGAEAGL
jgi:hypothetical protein